MRHASRQAVFYALSFFWLDGFAAPALVVELVETQRRYPLQGRWRKPLGVPLQRKNNMKTVTPIKPNYDMINRDDKIKVDIHTNKLDMFIKVMSVVSIIFWILLGALSASIIQESSQ